MGLHIGTSGYNYYGWIGKFYPEKMNTKKMFQYYATIFDTVEINYTFYHTPKEKTMLSWYKAAPANFKYTLKVPKNITHIKRLKDCDDLIEQFNNLALLLKEKCGVLLFQMPPSFKLNEENLKRLEYSFKLLKKELIYTIEFRHNSWFESDEPRALCKKFNVAFCIVSAPRIKFVPIVTSKNVYIRLHGKDKWYNYNYSKKELKEFAILTKEYLSNNLEVWIYFNNDFNCYAPENALLLRELIDKK